MRGIASFALACAAGPPLEVHIVVRPGLQDLVAEVLTEGVPPEDVAWSWTEAGRTTGFQGPVVPAAALAPGQQWTVTARHRRRSGSAATSVPSPPGGNVIVVVLDDVGIEKLSAFGSARAPTTPTIDALAARGVRFDRAYASPTCTPTRAELLTGRHASRHGAGSVLDLHGDTWELPLEALTLPEALAVAPGRYTTSAVGKWHLSTPRSPSGHHHPVRQGFGWYAGSLGYLPSGEAHGLVDGYFRWEKTLPDGTTAMSTTYNTTDVVDDALARVRSMPEPFLLWVALNAPHQPLHAPPADLLGRAVDPRSPATELHAAMLEAADRELGRLFDGIPAAVLDATTVVLLADNGTAQAAVDAGRDPDRAKGTVYEGGVHVPLIVAGPHVGAPGVSHTLVHAVDVFATVAELAGVRLTGPVGAQSVVLSDGTTRRIDGRSLLPQLDPERWDPEPRPAIGHEQVLVEALRPNGAPPWREARALRDDHHALVRTDDGDELYAVVDGVADERLELLATGSDEALDAWGRLDEALDALLSGLPYEGF